MSAPIVFIGDSNTAGYPQKGLFEHAINRTFPEIICGWLGAPRLQAARCGATVGGPAGGSRPGIARTGAFKRLGEQLRCCPVAVIVALGTNDVGKTLLGHHRWPLSQRAIWARWHLW